jgi:hypothetical protein
MCRTWWDIQIKVHWLLIQLQVDLTIWFDQDLKVKKDQIVHMAIAGPFEGPPAVEAAEKALPCMEFGFGI